MQASSSSASAAAAILINTSDCPGNMDDCFGHVFTAVPPCSCCVCIHAGAANRSIDCAGRAVSDPSQATSSTEQVKQLVQEMPQNCDYSINDRTQPNAVFV